MGFASHGVFNRVALQIFADVNRRVFVRRREILEVVDVLVELIALHLGSPDAERAAFILRNALLKEVDLLLVRARRRISSSRLNCKRNRDQFRQYYLHCLGVVVNRGPLEWNGALA